MRYGAWTYIFSTTTVDTGDLYRYGMGVKAIQHALGITEDKIYGPDTEAAVRSFQKSNGIGVDGKVGPVTMKALLLPSIRDAAAAHNVPHDYLPGLARKESSYDCSCLGYDDHDDRGLYQSNRIAQSNISDDEAFTPTIVSPIYAAEMRAKHDDYAAIHKSRAWGGAILHHHSPAWADYYVAHGFAALDSKFGAGTSQKARDYVYNVELGA